MRCSGQVRKAVCVALFMASLCAMTAVGQTAFVHTRGKEILDGSGKPLLLRGTNLGNWMVPEGYMWRLDGGGPVSPTEIERFVEECLGPTKAEAFWKQYRETYITQDDIRAIKAQGFNMVRVPLHWKFFTTDDADGFRLLDRVVKWSQEAGLYVMLDLHAAPGGQTGYNIDDGNGFPWLFRDAGAQQQTIDLWTRLAKHYAGNKTVMGYDLLNEPIPNYPGLDVLNADLEPLYKRIGAAIRTVDKNHSLVLGGAQWDQNFKIFGKPFDSNIIYTCHRYKATPTVAGLQDFIAIRDEYNVPMWMGETGENTDEWVGSFRAAMDASGMGWAFWPYKKMERTSSVATFHPPAGWDQVIAFAKLPRSAANSKERLKARPPQAVLDSAFDGLLQNIRFKPEQINAGYVHALIPVDGQR